MSFCRGDCLQMQTAYLPTSNVWCFRHVIVSVFPSTIVNGIWYQPVPPSCVTYVNSVLQETDPGSDWKDLISPLLKYQEASTVATHGLPQLSQSNHIKQKCLVILKLHSVSCSLRNKHWSLDRAHRSHLGEPMYVFCIRYVVSGILDLSVW